MIILGLNILHGDSATFLIRKGKLLSAAEEERFVRIKHASNLPIHAWNAFCQTSVKSLILKNWLIQKKNNQFLIRKIFFI